MILVEKKCPSCGASLSFNSNDKEVICEYCNTSFEVEPDSSDLNIDPQKVNEVANSILDSFVLHKKVANGVGKAFIFIWIFVFIFIIGVFIIMAFNIIPRVLG